MQNKGLEGTFNTVARQFEKNRPVILNRFMKQFLPVEI